MVCCIETLPQIANRLVAIRQPLVQNLDLALLRGVALRHVCTIAAGRFDAEHPIELRGVDAPLSCLIETLGKPPVLHRAVQG